MLAMAICPLWWSALSERSGRRTVYIISFALFTVFGVCSAVSTNIGMLIAFRVLSGASASSMQAVGAGTIADIWDVKERGRAMGWFYLGPLYVIPTLLPSRIVANICEFKRCGPLFSPVIGGALTGRFGWRSTQWFLAIYGVVLWFMMLFGLPETLRKKPVVPKVSSEKEGDNALERSISRVSIKKAKEWTVTARHIFIDPLKALRYLKFPPVLLTVFYASMTFTVLVCLPILSGLETLLIGCLNSTSSTYPSKPPSQNRLTTSTSSSLVSSTSPPHSATSPAPKSVVAGPTLS